MEEINDQKEKKLFIKLELEINTKEKWESKLEVPS